MRIFNTAVYGLEESIVRSGYPMLTNIGLMDNIQKEIYHTPFDAAHIKRAIKLANCKTGTGHDNFLKGIIVQMDVEAPQYVWMQIERYQFFTIISSQSKMHRLMQMDIESPDLVTYEGVANLQKCRSRREYGEIGMDELMSNVPMGLELTAGISTNYMCLKNMYHQRKHHRLKFWTDVFCTWVESLPMSRELITQSA